MEILVATHKKVDYTLPANYRFMQVNCSKTGQHWSGYLHDDEGINISEKNDSYCELTVLYSQWKNSHEVIKGLCHYRRFFLSLQLEEIGLMKSMRCSKSEIKKLALQQSEIVEAAQKYDMLLPIPNDLYPNNGETDLLQYCYKKDIDILRSVINDDYPDYEDAFNWVMEQRFLSACNMLIAKQQIFDEYCEWLFDVLEKVERKCDISSYDSQHKRIFGYLAEHLLNVYVKKNRLNCKYIPRVLVDEYWPLQKGIKAFIKKSYPYKKLIQSNSAEFVIWYYKHFRKKPYHHYLMLKQYLSDREAEQIGRER